MSALVPEDFGALVSAKVEDAEIKTPETALVVKESNPGGKPKLLGKILGQDIHATFYDEMDHLTAQQLQKFQLLTAEQKQNQQVVADAKAKAQATVKLLETKYDMKKVDLKILSQILPMSTSALVIEKLEALGVPGEEVPMYVDVWHTIEGKESPMGVLGKMLKALGAPSGVELVGGLAGGLAGGGKTTTQAAIQKLHEQAKFAEYQAAQAKQEAAFHQWQLQQQAYMQNLEAKIFDPPKSLVQGPGPDLFLGGQPLYSSEALKKQINQEFLFKSGSLPLPALMFKGYKVKLDALVPSGKMVFLNPDPTQTMQSVTIEDAHALLPEPLMVQMTEIVNQGYTDIHASTQAYENYEAALLGK